MIDMTIGDILHALSLGVSTLAILWKMARNQGEAKSDAKQLRKDVEALQKAIDEGRADQEKMMRLDVWAPSMKGLEDRFGRAESRIDRIETKVFDGK